MLRSVLPLSNAVHTRTDTTSKLLLELSERDLADGAPDTNGSTEPEEEAEAEEQHRHQAAALASVITQAAAPAPKCAAPEPQPGGADSRTSWRAKLRHLLCCLMPASREPYVRQDEGPAVIRPPPLPSLPRWDAPVIGPPAPRDSGKKCLVLDLDETLVHSSFRPVPSPDYVIPVEIEGRVVDVYVLKRPYVDHFLRAAGQRFEVVVFTASLGKYADPLLDQLDRSGVVRWRLFREACYAYEGSYVKDLQCMGRDLSQTIIVDNSPHSYAFQPECAVPIGTFIDDMQDQELLDCLDVLLAVEKAEDVRAALPRTLARKAAGLPLAPADATAA